MACTKKRDTYQVLYMLSIVRARFIFKKDVPGYIRCIGVSYILGMCEYEKNEKLGQKNT